MHLLFVCAICAVDCTVEVCFSFDSVQVMFCSCCSERYCRGTEGAWSYTCTYTFTYMCMQFGFRVYKSAYRQAVQHALHVDGIERPIQTNFSLRVCVCASVFLPTTWIIGIMRKAHHHVTQFTRLQYACIAYSFCSIICTRRDVS